MAVVARSKGLAGEFKEFINRGNVIDLAVAVVLGAAFTAVVTAFVNRIILQLVAAVIGKPSFSDIVVHLGTHVSPVTDAAGKPVLDAAGNPVTTVGTPIYIGDFLTAVVNFLIIALVVFFVVKAFNALRRNRSDEEAAEEPTELDVLTEIRDLLRDGSRPA